MARRFQNDGFIVRLKGSENETLIDADKLEIKGNFLFYYLGDKVSAIYLPEECEYIYLGAAKEVETDDGRIIYRLMTDEEVQEQEAKIDSMLRGFRRRKENK